MKTLMSQALLMIALQLPIGGWCVSPDIDRNELLQLIESRADVLLLDVRTSSEFAAGNIPGSMNVPVNELGRHLQAIRERGAEQVIVYCAAGPRALSAQKLLTEAGVGNVRHLLGDMSGWRSAGMPMDP